MKGTLHWVSADHALSADVRLYDRLFSTEQPGTTDERHFSGELNPESLETINTAWVEPSVQGAPPESRFQFERLGYFAVDPDSRDDRPVFNRTVTLKDSWARIEARERTQG